MCVGGGGGGRGGGGTDGRGAWGSTLKIVFCLLSDKEGQLCVGKQRGCNKNFVKDDVILT